MIERATCPVCTRNIPLIVATGEFRIHGPRHDRCLGSRRTPEAAGMYVLSPTERQWELIHECWRVGDVRPIEREFGIAYRHPPSFYYCQSVESELAEMICDAQNWIATLAERADVNAVK